MTEKELTIGDFVQFNNKVIKVYQPINDYGYLTDERHGNEYNIEDIKPIPITSEILEKNGFVRYGLSDIYGINNAELNLNSTINISNHDCTIRSEYVTVNNRSMLYVHELQHALRLCNINKEIEI